MPNTNAIMERVVGSVALESLLVASLVAVFSFSPIDSCFITLILSKSLALNKENHSVE